MSIRKVLYFIFLFFVISLNVFALESREIINPEWLKYMSLSETDKLRYEAIPEKYINEYVDNSSTNIKSYKKSQFGIKLDILPSYFSLADYNGKQYVNSSSKNQSSLGLCWAFGAIGSTESNILLNGVKGIDDKISLCDDSEENKYCSYKIDNELNEKYRNKLIKDNATFSERVVDYITSKPSNTSAYYSPGTYRVITEEYNPYNIFRSFGSGGNFSDVGKLYDYGITPIRTLNEWSSYNTYFTEKSLYQVYDSPGTTYQVTDYYSYPSVPANPVQKEAWIKDLKSNILKYGSLYVSTVAPQSSSARSCYYYDTKYNVDGEKKYIHLINYQGNCGSGSLGWHAMQIIGWDDNYSFGYCKVDNYASDSYTKETCENAGYIWTEGKGAWILKNSWGTSKTYPYLSYQSTGLSISGVREVAVKDYDNSYNNIFSIIDKKEKSTTLNGYATKEKIHKFRKPEGVEYLTSVNVKYYISGGPYQVYISNDGIDYKLISEGIVDYKGLRTYNTNNYELTNEEFYVKVINNGIDTIHAFTKNECSKENTCDDNMSIKTILNKTNYEENSATYFRVFTETRNIKSGSRIDYKFFNSDGEDITNLFDIPVTYVINNANVVHISTKGYVSLLPGRYKLVSSYEDASSELYFNVLGDDITLSLVAPNEIFLDKGSVKINAKLSTTTGVNGYNWSTSDSSIATVDSEGNLTLLNSGKVTVKLILDTIYGDISSEVDIVIYEKINNVDEFLNIMSDVNNKGAYYLTSDLDFDGIDYKQRIGDNKYFKGIFEGNYHIIKNINYSEEEAGIFPYLVDAEVKNIKIFSSTLNGNLFAGALTAFADNSKISGIYNEAEVNSNTTAGGIVGYANNTILSESYNGGNITSTIKDSNTYIGGIVGQASNSTIKDSYNEGKLYLSLSNEHVQNTVNYEGGILGYSMDTKIQDVYNVGVVNSDNNIDVVINKSGITNNYDNVSNSYYLKDDKYNIINENYEKSIEELKSKSNYLNWDFNNIWKIVEGKHTPILKKYPIEVTNIDFNIFSKTLNTNYTYDFTYEVVPYGSSDNVKIKSEDTELFDVINNKIITKNKVGSSYITFIVDNKEYSFPITVVNLFDIEYDKTLVANYVDINTNYSYYLTKMNNEYIKLEYNIDNVSNSHSFIENVINDKYTFRIDNNGILNIKLYLCKDSNCSILREEIIDINNIDKLRPVIKYETNNIKKTIKINITDDNELSDNNDYSYGLSSSDKIKPTVFRKYTLNTLFNDLSLSNENYYLWVKRVFDKSGNGLCDSAYCVYKLDLEDNYYNLLYYNEDQKTLLKKERYLENTLVVPTFNSTKKSNDNFDYVFDSWIGYTKGMKLTKNTSFVAKYRGIFRGLSSRNYIIENGVIRGINNNDINTKYSVEKFKSNINSSEKYNFYLNKIIYPEYIKTGMIYKSDYRSFKIALSGDVTGDGLIKMNDVMKIANEIVNGNILKDEYYIAGDVTNDGKVKMNDVMKIAAGLVNGGSL